MTPETDAALRTLIRRVERAVRFIDRPTSPAAEDLRRACAEARRIAGMPPAG